MAKGKLVAEFGQLAAGVLSRVGLVHAVVKMNFGFAPSRAAVLGEHLDQFLVILLGGIKVSVDERAAVVIAKALDDFRILAEPDFLATQLFGARNALVAAGRIEGGFKMIGERED